MEMKNFVKVVGLVSCFFVSGTVSAQQDILLSQEYFSRVNKNPASTGNSEDVDIFLHGKILWAGVENGPKNMVLNVTDYIEKIKSGLGVSVSYTNVGVGHHATNAKVIYNYQVDLNEHFILSMGLGAGINLISMDYLANSIEDETERHEVDYLNEKQSKISPDINVGFELNNPHWTLGVSMAHVLSGDTTVLKPKRHFYAYTSFSCPIGDNWALVPMLAYMHQKQANVADIGLLAFFQGSYWGGVSWRPDIQDQLQQSLLAFSVGFEIKKFRFGYSFDLGLGSDNMLPSNTHEVMLSYGISKKGNKNR